MTLLKVTGNKLQVILCFAYIDKKSYNGIPPF